MDITYMYEKKRSDFGRQCLFSDKGPDLIDNYPADRTLHKDYIQRDPVHRGMLYAPVFAEHELNTIRADFVNSGINHVEGGWPKDVNLNDEEQTKRYRRKVEKDDNYYPTMMPLFASMEECILQNNAINIYQHYFVDVEPLPMTEKSSARTVNVYQDQCNPPRPISSLSWSPDNQTKLAAAHCSLIFQGPQEVTNSYIWEVENPNQPLLTLKSEHSMVCLEYNPKDPHSLVSGQKNGQVAVWDVRKSGEPVDMSVIENSFRDPVQNVLWIHSKTGAEFFSSSTDGQVKWWDLRKLSEPTDVLILDYARDDSQMMENALGASCLEYEITIPTRFTVGTEKGTIISCNRKGKTAMEKMAVRLNAHLGPVLTVQRNPGFIKNFLSIGDWTAKIWSEDCRESSIMWTSFHKAMLTGGAWSPTRLSVFFTTRSDGILDAWDILQQQKHAVFGVKISDEPLKCLSPHEMGRLVAVGNQRGTINLVEFTENLSLCNKNDKALLNTMFERESHREKILEARNRELRLKMRQEQGKMDDDEEENVVVQEPLMEEGVFLDRFVAQAEEDFYQTIEKEINRNKPLEDQPEGADDEVEEVLLEPEPEPLPSPPKSPPLEEKKGKGKGKKKK